MTLTRDGSATFGGVGYLRPAPGTWGSFAALPVAWGLHVLGGFWLLLGCHIGCLSRWAGGPPLLRRAARPMPTRLRLSSDEVVGMWIALWPVSLGAMMQGGGFLSRALWPGWVTAFLALSRL